MGPHGMLFTGPPTHLGHPHVSKLDVQVVIQEHIQRLDVPVEDLLGVHVIQPQQDLCEGCGQGSRGVMATQGGQVGISTGLPFTGNFKTWTPMQVTRAVAGHP